MPGIMLITYMHCDFIGTSTKWYRNNFYKWGKWGYNGLKLCPILPRRWVSWDLSQWPPWFFDSKICELDNTMLFQNWASSSVPSHQHIWSPVDSPPPWEWTPTHPFYFCDSANFMTTSLCPQLFFESISSLFLSAMASMFPLLSTSSLFSVSHAPALQESISLCSRTIYSHRFLVWAVQNPTPVNTPISCLGNLSLCTDVGL